MCVLSPFSHVQLFVTPWTAARQSPQSIGFSRQEYWSGLLCPPLGDLSDPGIQPASFMSPALAGGFFTTEPLGKPRYRSTKILSPEKSVCGSRSDSWNPVWNSWLVQDWEGVWQDVCCHLVCLIYRLSTSSEMPSGWVTSLNQDRQEKYQQPQICRYYSNGQKAKRN